MEQERIEKVIESLMKGLDNTEESILKEIRQEIIPVLVRCFLPKLKSTISQEDFEDLTSLVPFLAFDTLYLYSSLVPISSKARLELIRFMKDDLDFLFEKVLRTCEKRQNLAGLH